MGPEQKLSGTSYVGTPKDFFGQSDALQGVKDHLDALIPPDAATLAGYNLGCSKCYGRGHVGKSMATGQLVPCVACWKRRDRNKARGAR